MGAILKNKAVMTLTSANIAETLGISIFNIILLTYAKSFSNPNIMVSIVSIATIIPGTLGFLSGRWADYSANKSRALIAVKVLQAVLYLILSMIITEKTVYIFLTVVIINILSDFLGEYSSSLRLPIIKTKVEDDYRQQVLGLNQSVSSLLQPIGQSIGVVIIEVTHDYALAGMINAVTFLLAAIVLYFGKNAIKVPRIEHVQEEKTQTEHFGVLKRTLKLLGQSAGLNVGRLLVTVVMINAVGASFDAMVNLFLLDHKNLSIMPFSVEILVVNILFIMGTVAGSISKIKIIDDLSVKATMGITVGIMVVLFVNFLFVNNYYFLIVIMFCMSFGMAKINPKLMAQIIKNSDEDMLGTISGTLNSLVTVAVPIGSIGLVLLYNAISPASAYYTAIVLLVGSLIILLGDKQSAAE